MLLREREREAEKEREKMRGYLIKSAALKMEAVQYPVVQQLMHFCKYTLYLYKLSCTDFSYIPCKYL